MIHCVDDELFCEIFAHATARHAERRSAALNIAVREYRKRREIEPSEEIVDEFTRPRVILWGANDGTA